MKDITSIEDITLWQNAFYQKLLNDETTAPKFSHLNLAEHMPKIVAFWSFVLLDVEGYKTNVFDQHIHLNLEKIHFDKWINYFIATTDEMFQGANAEVAKQRVKMIATTFMHKLTGEYHAF
ncbi:MAG: group III truncated hemoglobin [Bacteroidota bacterium]|nr:group III truncated hemoglobin [Bacteroidota bacterium]